MTKAEQIQQTAAQIDDYLPILEDALLDHDGELAREAFDIVYTTFSAHRQLVRDTRRIRDMAQILMQMDRIIRRLGF